MEKCKLDNLKIDISYGVSKELIEKTDRIRQLLNEIGNDKVIYYKKIKF